MENNTGQAKAEVLSLLDRLKTVRLNWDEEAKLVEQIHNLLPGHSFSQLVPLLDKSKGWISVSLEIAKCLRVYPDLPKITSRNLAYKYIRDKRKMRDFLNDRGIRN